MTNNTLITEPQVRTALIGEVVAVEMNSAFGSYTLVYSTGRRVRIDTGHVGAEVYVLDPGGAR